MDENRKEEARLVQENIGLVISQAKKFKPTRVTDVDDYIQAGSIGLLKAIRKYDPLTHKDTKLSSFAWIAILREIVHEANKFKETTQTLEFEVPVSAIEEFKDNLPNLSEHELEIIMLRAEGYTLKEIGAKFNKTKEWARQQLKAIIQKVRDLYDEPEEENPTYW
jgi:RNA polymerase sigma factor (sigma-70 family)